MRTEAGCYNLGQALAAQLESAGRQVVAEDWGHQSDLEVVERLIKLEDRFIIDAGCGAGDLCRALAERGAQVLGIEPDPVQAEKNNQAPVVANVGFAQAGAGAVPVESNSVDGVIFAYSMHHVPASQYSMVFQEVQRILKNDGFLYVMEPVANGPSQHVMELFHDETSVRLRAYNALVEYAQPMFERSREVYYDVDRTYRNFADYVNHYVGLSYNRYPASSVRDRQVQERFEQCGNSQGSYTLTQPMRVNLYMRLLS